MFRIYTYFICIIICIPPLVILSSSFTKAQFISFPPELFSLKWWKAFATSDPYQRSVWLSIRISALAAPLSMIMGLLSAIILIRYKFKGRSLLSAFFNMPYTVPQIVFALASLLLYARYGYINIFHFVIAHVVITLPRNIRIISAGLQGTDPDLERCAKILGANDFVAFYKITLPQIKSGLIGAFLYTFLSSFNNTTIALFLGNPKLWTLPARIFSEVEFFAYPSLIAASSFSLIITLIFMVIIHKYVGIASVYK